MLTIDKLETKRDTALQGKLHSILHQMIDQFAQFRNIRRHHQLCVGELRRQHNRLGIDHRHIGLRNLIQHLYQIGLSIFDMLTRPSIIRSSFWLLFCISRMS